MPERFLRFLRLPEPDHEVGVMVRHGRISVLEQLFFRPNLVAAPDNPAQIPRRLFARDSQEQILRLIPRGIGNLLQRNVVPLPFENPLTLFRRTGHGDHDHILRRHGRLFLFRDVRQRPLRSGFPDMRR